MDQRKFKAERIFDGQNILEDHVLLTGADGTIIRLMPASEAGEDVETVPGLLSPGLVNCHCHLELSHMRGLIPEKTGLVDFVFAIVTQRHQDESHILDAIRQAEEEMLQDGIVAVGDICNNTLSLPQKRKARLAYYNFIEASGWLPAVAAQRLERAASLYERFREENPFCSVVPHAPYSVSEELWEAIKPYFSGRVVTIHSQETIFEDDFFKNGSGDFQRMYQLMKIDNAHHQPTGRSSLQSFYNNLLPAGRALLVHNTFVQQQDIDFINALSAGDGRKPENFFCLCINANLYIENALPPVEMLRKNGATLVLGTDSLASNHSLSIMSEIRTLRASFPHLPLEEILRWATMNGARALMMEERLGSFEAGKKPGVIAIDETSLRATRII